MDRGGQRLEALTIGTRRRERESMSMAKRGGETKRSKGDEEGERRCDGYLLISP